MNLVSDRVWGGATVWLEPRGESFEGQVAVAAVILRRAKQHLRSDGTIFGTVFAPRQFSCWNEVTSALRYLARMDDTEPMVRQCLQAWDEAANLGHDPALGATHYLNVDATRRSRPDGALPAWAADPADSTRINGALVTVVIGKHTFLRTA